MNSPTPISVSTRTSRRNRLVGPALVLAASALAFTACSSDDTSSDADTPVETEADATSDAPADGGDAPAAGGSTVDIADFLYEPNPIEISAGTEVTWTNQDDFDHTVTSDGDAASFDSGNLAQSETFAMTFDEPGTYAYLCTIHTQMKAEIVVS